MVAPSNDYVIDVLTAQELGDRRFAERLLSAWCRELEPRLRPEFFSLGEPVRRSLRVEGVEEAVRTWVEHQMPVMLRRSASPRFLASIDWRSEKGLDSRPFPWSCTVWLDRRAGDALAGKLFRFLIEQFGAAFGSVSTEEERRRKHRIVFQDRVGQVEKSLGQDFVETIPGVYWLTFFGAAAVEKIGRDAFRTLPSDLATPYGDGCLIQAYDSVSDAGGTEARQAEQDIIELLGPRRFFDISRVDIESLRIDSTTASMIEAEIRARREGRSEQG